MKIFAASAVVLLCFITIAAAQPAREPLNRPPAEPSIAPAMGLSAPPAGREVEFEACPEKGTEGDCVLIRYGEDVFDITGADPKIPLNGKGVKIKGVVEPGSAGICYATALKNISWEQTGLECAGPKESH
jgi:hypothetical protein